MKKNLYYVKKRNLSQKKPKTCCHWSRFACFGLFYPLQSESLELKDTHKLFASPQTLCTTGSPDIILLIFNLRHCKAINLDLD